MKVDYEQFIPRESGFIFKFTKTDGQFIHTFIEGKLIEKIGLTPERVTGKSLYEILPSDHATRKEMFYEKAWNGENINYEGYLEGVHYLAILQPIRKNSETIEVIGTAIDFTKEKEHEMQLRQMEKLSVIGELAAGIAHEIRNPLTSLKGFTKIVRESVTSPSVKEYLDIMQEEMERINTIVNEFMFIAKPNEHIQFKQTNLGELMQHCIQFMKPQAMLKSVKLRLSLQTDIIISCDPNQIKQVMINLLQNAIEATPNNGPSIDVFVKVLKDSDIMIRIDDKGIGIPEARQKHLFEPFYSTKEKGTGLGLIMCKRIIELHEGSIEIVSRDGEGTTINIFLPKQRTAAMIG